MDGLKVEVEDRHPWALLRIVGEVDIPSANVLREALHAQLALGKFRLVLDMTGVEYLDSTGLGVLTGALKRARANDGDVCIVVTNPRIRTVFEVTGLVRVFRLGATYEEVAVGQPSAT